MDIITVFSVIIILLFHLVALQKKSVPDKLFAEALRNENSGHLGTGIITNERALNEVKKIRFLRDALMMIRIFQPKLSYDEKNAKPVYPPTFAVAVINQILISQTGAGNRRSLTDLTPSFSCPVNKLPFNYAIRL